MFLAAPGLVEGLKPYTSWKHFYLSLNELQQMGSFNVKIKSG